VNDGTRVRHLYVHLPFCVHRCGYCDFVTAVGRREQHGPYVEALLAELALERDVLADELDTVFLGGGTPTFTEPRALARLLAALPPATETTVEANPETVTPELAALLRAHGVNRVSLGAQSFQPHLLAVLERRAAPETVRLAFARLREAGFDNVSLDLIYGIPGQSLDDLDDDLAAALALEPEHLSWYELEAKPGTRFTHAHGEGLAQQQGAMETYFERVITHMQRAGYRWYETANFCRTAAAAHGRDLRARHNLGYWHGRDYLGLGIGAVSTVAGRRWRNAPRLRAYVEALARRERPPRELEPLPPAVRTRERVMLGLRLDEPLPLAGIGQAIDRAALARLEQLRLARLTSGDDEREALTLTSRGRMLGGGVTAELLA
jgi:putative oxygen-independent coproporphyrinogen III oxidase